MLILLYLCDSLRRDFLGCYGDTGAITPHLDRFAAEATRFTHAYAAAPWSKASGAALLTGYLPRAVQMRALLGKLPPAVPTLAERLGAAGFATVAVSANPFISHDFGLLRGFASTVEGFQPGVLPGEHFRFHPEHFRRLAETLSVEPEQLCLARSPALHDALLDLLPSDTPTLALCWSMDTHAPFFVRGERSWFGNPLDRIIPAADPMWLTQGLTVRDLRSLYRDMIAFNDTHFGTLVETLKARGRWEDALVIVAGDHGEAFGEHGLMGHINGLWEEQIAIPLLVKFPGQHEAKYCDRPVSLLDIVPSVEQLVDLATPTGEPSDGVALQRVLRGEEPARPLLLENPEGWALRQDEWKLLAPTDDATPLLFNLRTDPAEQRPLADPSLHSALAAQAARLRAQADERAAAWAAEEIEMDEIMQARLRALGYL